MNDLPMARRPEVGIAVPSREGLRLILCGTAYLLAICLLQLVSALSSIVSGLLILPKNAMDVRDVVALFGWVGLMICGVSVIIVPNHLRVRLRPAYLPKLHLGLANVGLVGYFATALLWPEGALPNGFLTVLSASFLLFGSGVAVTILPFLRRPQDRAVFRASARTPESSST